MIEKYSTYLNESKESSMKIGDTVVVKDTFRSGGYKLHKGEKFKICGMANIGSMKYISIKTLDAYWPGNPPSIEKGIFFGSFFIDNFETLEEHEQKREEHKLKMADIDPYSEEDWENESVKVDVIGKYGNRIFINSLENSLGPEGCLDYLKRNLIDREVSFDSRGVYETVKEDFKKGIIHEFQRFKFKVKDITHKKDVTHEYFFIDENGDKYLAYQHSNVDWNFTPKELEERKRKREEIKLKMKDIDPYSEEDWENESKINEEYIEWWEKGELKEDPKSSEYFDDFLTDAEFRDFLIRNNAYESFIEYANKSFSDDFEYEFEHGRYSYIDHAFTWSDTREGSDFWVNLDNKWRKHLETLGY